MAVATGSRQCQHLCRHGFGQTMRQRFAIGVQHLGHTGHLGGGLGGTCRIQPRHQDMHLAAQLGRRADGVER